MPSNAHRIFFTDAVESISLRSCGGIGSRAEFSSAISPQRSIAAPQYAAACRTIDLPIALSCDQTSVGARFPSCSPNFQKRLHHTSRNQFIRGWRDTASCFVSSDDTAPWNILDCFARRRSARRRLVLLTISTRNDGVNGERKGRDRSAWCALGCGMALRRCIFLITGGNIGAVQLPLHKTEVVPIALTLMLLPFEMDISSHRRMRQALYRALVELT